MRCNQCNTEVIGRVGPAKFFLCRTCRESLFFFCTVCGKQIYNVKNTIPATFLSKKTCSETCRNRAISENKLVNNPMKREDVVAKGLHTKLKKYGKTSGFRGPVSKEERAKLSKQMTQNNPMQNPETARKQGQIQRQLHQEDPSKWKQKYRDAKFKHFVAIAEGSSNVGPQRSGANSLATLFFSQLVRNLAWYMDEIYYDTCPYEYPLIVSRTAQICYFPDFFNKTRNIVIEWDESAHKYGHRATKDKRRDSQIMRKYPGIKIIRIDEDLIDKVKYIREQL